MTAALAQAAAEPVSEVSNKLEDSTAAFNTTFRAAVERSPAKDQPFMAKGAQKFSMTDLVKEVEGNTAVGMLAGSVLFGALASAGTTVQLFSDIPIQLVDVLQGTVTIFAVVRLAPLVRRRGRRRI